MSRSPSRRPALRGLFIRFVALLVGALIASAIVVAMQLPLLNRPMRVHVALSATTGSLPYESTALVWPSVGTAAIDIPALGVLEGYHSSVQPIASLTKMMTAYVALKRLPLGLGETGPCHVVTVGDLESYQDLAGLDESSVPVEVGEQLCELDLLNGVLVHSAGNYAVMLANMVAGDNDAFVALMNHEAASLGLRGTNYVDVTGLSPQSVSTALDQAKLAVLLMQSPLVRSIVDQSSVTLPYAGTVGSFTPDVGIENVIGVKSGRTLAAGGCDVMAMTFQDGTATRVLYAVVLGQRGGDLLGPAGDAALNLANSAVSSRRDYVFAKDVALGYVSFDGRRVGVGLSASHDVWWWPAQRLRVAIVRARRQMTSVRRGEVVGYLSVTGASRETFELRALGDLSPPSLLKRLR